MWGIFSFLFHLLHPKIFPKIYFFEDFLNHKINSKTVFFFNVWWQQRKNNCMVSTNFLTQKTIGKGNIFSIFLFQEMSLKRDVFVNFLPQKFKIKYGIVSTYSVNFVSQKILACLQCTGRNLEMESMKLVVKELKIVNQKTVNQKSLGWFLMMLPLHVDYPGW